MELGCGIRLKTVKRREYLYVWHYEPIEGRRRQVYDYIGPAANPEARRKAIDALEAHARKAIDDARRRIHAGRAVAAAVRSGLVTLK